MTSSPPIIEADNLVKRYAGPKGHDHVAVDHISFSVSGGEIFGILGPNGAGKTSTLEMLEGLLSIDGGSASIDGLDIASRPYAVKRIIGVQLQSSEYFERLDLLELLHLFCGIYGSARSPLQLLRQVDLEDKRHARPAQLSGGQRQRFTIACALANQPRVLFLDEPTTGLDPHARRRLWSLVRSLNDDGMTIVLTTHNMEEAQTLCHRVAIMDAGRIVAAGAPQTLIERHAAEVPQQTVSGNLEHVFLALTGHRLADADTDGEADEDEEADKGTDKAVSA